MSFENMKLKADIQVSLEDNWVLFQDEIIAICELVQDKRFPARHSILDYVSQIFGYPKEMEKFVANKLQECEVER